MNRTPSLVLAAALCGFLRAGAAWAQAPLGQGDTAPVATLAGPGGGTLDLSTYQGKVVLLNFWASWCAPCLEEMPRLDQLHTRLAPTDAAVVAVSIDRRIARAEGLVTHLGLSMPVAFDPKGELANHYQPQSLPVSFLIGADGQILEVFEGALDDAAVAKLETRIASLQQVGTQ